MSDRQVREQASKPASVGPGATLTQGYQGPPGSHHLCHQRHEVQTPKPLQELGPPRDLEGPNHLGAWATHIHRYLAFLALFPKWNR